MAQFKVVITDFGSPENEIEQAELQGSGLDIELVRLNSPSGKELFPQVADADALIVQWAKITPEVIAGLTKCRIISRYGIGVDMIDLAAATDRGILVCNDPEYCIEEVSTHTIGFLIMLNRRLLPQHLHVSSGKWGSPPGGAPARLSTQTLGIVGVGNIGQAVLHRARAFGLRMIAFDPYLPAERAKQLDLTLVSLDTLLEQADYVTLHCPLTDETRHLIGAPQLARMKPTAFLINMSRGPVVDQNALVHALTTHQIAGAALDVLVKEPPDADDPILKLDNVILTPHISSWSGASLVQLRRDTARNVIDLFQGKTPRSVVNRKALESNGKHL
jgi:D-3-phosphoglycerate dehydrogenase